MALKAGDKAPNFELQDDAGRTVKLSDFKGKSVVLYFYPKDMTPGCTQEACDFRDNWARVKAKGAMVLGVSRDSAESHAKFKEKYELPFPLLVDGETEVMKAYGAWGERSMYGRKFMGVLRTTIVIGPDGRVKAYFPKVKVKGHVDEVLAALA